MGLAQRLFAPAFAAESPSPPPPSDDFWYAPAGSATLTGLRISPEEALKLTVGWRCVNVLADTISALPFKLFERVRLDWQEPGEPPRGKRSALDHPLYPALHDQPNPHMTALEFWRLLVTQRLLWGNFFAEIVPGLSGNALLPLDPNGCEVMVKRGQEPYLRYRESGAPARAIPFTRLFRTSGLSLDGRIGLKTVELLREAVGLAHAGEQYAARIFASDGMQRTVITSDQKMTPDQIKTYREEWDRLFGGLTGAHTFAFLGGGAKPEKIGINPMEAQLIDGRKQQAIEICRMFGVPPHKAGIMDATSGYKTEEENLRFIIDTVQPFCVSIEQAVRRDLIDEAERARFYPKFMLTGLLRGDSNARSNYLVRMTQGGMFTPNEGREYEDLDPLEGLDEPMSPLNMRQGALAPQPEERGDDRGGDNSSGRAEQPGDTVGDLTPALRATPLRKERGRAEEQLGTKASSIALLRPAAQWLVGKEMAALAKEAERLGKRGDEQGEWESRVSAVYQKHGRLIRQVLPISDVAADQYCREHAALLKVHGAAALAEIEAEGAERLLAMLEDLTPALRATPLLSERGNSGLTPA